MRAPRIDHALIAGAVIAASLLAAGGFVSLHNTAFPQAAPLRMPWSTAR